ncbi:MAG: hypothetical protein K8U03_06160 [Planctomycetia bacterium]|nr:hypothetical protein [Planctomycetia bacterium]
MNRAPVALFALLCTLASSMVAAGVASDRPAGPSKSAHRFAERSGVKPASFASSPQEKWLTETSRKAIDIHRNIALPTKKLPVRIPEKVKPVAAIIITIEQPQAVVAKPVTKPAAQVKIEKPATITAAAKQPTKTATASLAQAAAVNVENLKKQFTLPAIALKAAPVQPRVTSLVKTTYAPKSTLGSVLPSNKISLADLHLSNRAVATTTGSIIVLPIEKLAAATAPMATTNNKITLSGGKLQMAYGSLNLISVAGSSWTPSPYITENGAGILPKFVSTTKLVARNTTLQSTTKNLGTLHPAVIRTSSDVAELGRQLNRLIAQYRTIYLPKWVPFHHADGNAPAIKSAQLKNGERSAVKK